MFSSKGLQLCLAYLMCIATSLANQNNEKKLEKSLFLPAYNYPQIQIQSAPIYSGLDQLQNYPYPILYNQGPYEYPDVTQRHQDDTRFNLGHLIFNGNGRQHHDRRQPEENRKIAEDEDKYHSELNSIVSSEEHKVGAYDLDYRYKRSLSYPQWSVPTVSGGGNYLSETPEDRSSAAVASSRSVSIQTPFSQPFGPYTTWSPYEGPAVASYSISQAGQTPYADNSLQKSHSRRRRDISTSTSYEANGAPVLKKEVVTPGAKSTSPIRESYGRSVVSSDAYLIPFPVSYPRPIIPTAPVVHGLHHIVPTYGPIFPGINKIFHTPGHTFVFN